MVFCNVVKLFGRVLLLSGMSLPDFTPVRIKKFNIVLTDYFFFVVRFSMDLSFIPCLFQKIIMDKK